MGESVYRRFGGGKSRFSDHKGDGVKMGRGPIYDGGFVSCANIPFISIIMNNNGCSPNLLGCGPGILYETE